MKLTPEQEAVRKRKHTRYRPDRLTIAWVQFNPAAEDFETDVHALVYEEAFGGCCLVMMFDRPLELGLRWMVKVGDLNPMEAEVVWFKNLDQDVWKVGLKFLK